MALDQRTHGYPSRASKPHCQPLFPVVFKFPIPMSVHSLPPSGRGALVCVLLVELAQNSQIDACGVALISRVQALTNLTEMTIN